MTRATRSWDGQNSTRQQEMKEVGNKSDARDRKGRSYESSSINIEVIAGGLSSFISCVVLYLINLDICERIQIRRSLLEHLETMKELFGEKTAEYTVPGWP